MTTSRVRLKHSSGWFAAGREFSRALEILSDGAFKIYAYACLSADRHNGCLAISPRQLAQVLRKDLDAISIGLNELRDLNICSSSVRSDSCLMLEISDAFWPYEKHPKGVDSPDSLQFVAEVRKLVIAPACVKANFSAADERIAANLHFRGVTIERVRRAILLGCARKYVAMINGETESAITSLKYFVSIIDEITEPRISEAYWKALSHKVQRLENQWLLQKSIRAAERNGSAGKQ